MKKILCVLLCLALFVTAAACSPAPETGPAGTPPADTASPVTPTAPQQPPQELEAEPAPAQTFIPGAYYGSVQGTSGVMTVKVSVSEDRIQSIQILESHELLHRKTIVEELLIPQIIEHQSLAVDSISCATLSSSAVLRAAAAALEQAGADMDALYEPITPSPAPSFTDGEKFDVIIVGAGISGMFASMELHEQNPGAKILVVDKSDFVGGSMTVSGAYLLCLDNEILRQQGKNRTPEQMADSFQAFSTGYDPEYVINRQLAINTGYALSDMWDILNQKDAPFDLGRPLTSVLGNSWYATDLMINESVLTLNAGNELTRYVEQFFYPSCELRLQSNVTKLITENGAVKGVEIASDAQIYSAYADNVILATGGHGPNDALMREFNPDYAGNVALGHKDSDGSGIELTRELGTHTMGWGLCGVMGVDFMPYSFAYPYGMLGMYAANMVNLNGEIFANNREQINESPEQIAYSLWDTNSPYYSILEDVETLNIGHKFNTAEELADSVSQRYTLADRDAFIAAVNQNIADSGLTAPYYAVRNAFTFYCSNVGLVVNEYCQPLNANNEIIPNLYCVGELILGNYYTGAYAQVGSGLGLSASSGIVAAQHIAAN